MYVFIVGYFVDSLTSQIIETTILSLKKLTIV